MDNARHALSPSSVCVCLRLLKPAVRSSSNRYCKKTASESCLICGDLVTPQKPKRYLLFRFSASSLPLFLHPYLAPKSATLVFFGCISWFWQKLEPTTNISMHCHEGQQQTWFFLHSSPFALSSSPSPASPLASVSFLCNTDLPQEFVLFLQRQGGLVSAFDRHHQSEVGPWPLDCCRLDR